MPIQPIMSSRLAIPLEFISGTAVQLTNFTGAWLPFCVDYGNNGNELSPPTLENVNISYPTVTGTAATTGENIGIYLPLSAEGTLVLASAGMIQHRRPRWAHK